MKIVRIVQDLRVEMAAWRKAGLRSAVVPTMGSLHDGHLSLVRQGQEVADRVVATLFVNPTQFNDPKDLEVYPRDEGADAVMLRAEGCNLLFAPSPDEMYPQGFATKVLVTGLTDCLCGETRPGHFDGVAQVVTKLLNQAQADVAIFGEKDWQQLAVVRRLARDLDIPTRIDGAPTVREADGLAMSSRNRYLSADERGLAAGLPRIMADTAKAITSGESAEHACRSGTAELIASGFRSVDYMEARDGETLRPSTGPGARLFVAAHLGRARLIDNIPLG